MKKFLPVFIIFVVTLFAFFPIFFGKIPLNSRNLVAFFTPWYYEKFPGFPAGVPSKPGMLDQIRLYYPYMSLTQWSYQHQELPLWNPYNFAGNPHMAEWQSGVFYPLHLLLPLLPLPVYWSLFQITGFFFAGYFTYLYLGNIGLRKLSSVFGGLTFMLSSFMTTWNMEVVTAPHSILWLPLILLAVDKLASCHSGQRSGIYINDSKVKRWWFIGLAGIVFSILAGYWQTTLYVMVISALYILYRWFFGRTLIPTKSESAGTPEPRRTRALATHERRPWEQVSVVWGLFLWFPLSLALTSFHLLPTWELFERSSRPAVNSSSEIQQILISYLLPLRHVVTLFAPDYFGHPTTRNYFANVGGGTYYEHALFVGTLPLFLSLFAIGYGIKRREKNILFWLVIAAIAASFSFRTPWARWVYDLHVPVLSTGIANRILFIPAFALSVLAAFGFEHVKETSVRRMLWFLVGGAFVLVAGLLIVTIDARSGLGAYDPALNPRLFMTSLRNIALPLSVFVVGAVLIVFFGSGKNRTIAMMLILATSLIQTLYQHHKFTAFSESELTYPLHPTIQWLKTNGGINRFIGYNGQFLNNDFATFFQIYTVEGYDSLNDFRRSLLLHSAETGSVNVAPPRSADASLGADLSNPRILRLMQLFGIKYLVDHPEWLDVGPTKGLLRLPETNQKLVFEKGDWKIWEYLDALPRAYLVGGYEVIPDGQSTIDRLYDASFDPGTSVLLNKPLPAGFSIQPDKLAKVTVVSYMPMKIIFETRSATDQILFLSDTWYPGWRARLENSRTLPVLAADYALRAVPIPAGNHTVTMWYFPDSFRNGLIISLIAFITVITFIKFITFNHEET